MTAADLGAAIKSLPEDLAAATQRLATLPPLEYDRVRRSEAKRLGVRVPILDREVERLRTDESKAAGQGRPLDLPSPELWPEPVEGSALLDDLANAFHRYLALPESAAEVMALWVLHAHTFNAAQVTPRLALTSPEKRCGKTTALTVLGRLVPRPLPVANVTPAAVFRTVELAQPTLLIDEADSFLRHSGELRGVLNSGHLRAGAYVVRTVGDDHEPRQFATWAPVAVAMIGRLPGTLEDRSIIIHMRRRRPDEAVDRLRLDRTSDLDLLARKAARYARDHMAALADTDPTVPAGLHDRAADNWRPLLAIADLAGSDWAERARKAAKLLTVNEPDADSAGVMLLADIRDLFVEKVTDKLASAEIIETLTNNEERPWPEWRNGKPLTTRQLAAILKPFGIKPKNIRLDGRHTPKGYDRADFGDAFSRYLRSQSATAPQPKETAAFSECSPATSEDDVADRNSAKVPGNLSCGAVADRQGDPGGDDDLLDMPDFLRRIPVPNGISRRLPGLGRGSGEPGPGLPHRP